jgi:acyl phosphate:glycerol-3-phosphate acyltransferase
MMAWLINGGTLLSAYLLGSLPFSYWVARLRGVDVRAVGSGNVGATNVLRAAGWAAGAAAFVLDALKGTCACLIGGWVQPHGWLAPSAAAIAVAGHVYPVWLRFRGGKGAATGLGAFVLLAPLATVGALLVFAIVLVSTRYVSLSSMLAAVAQPVLVMALGAGPAVGLCSAAVAALIVVRHRVNALRIVRGTERRVGMLQDAPREVGAA